MEKEEKENKDKSDADAEFLLELLRSGVPNRDGSQVRATGTSTRSLVDLLPLKATAKE